MENLCILMLPLLILFLLHMLPEDRPGTIKDKEKLKYDKYSQQCQLIDSDFMPMAFKQIRDIKKE